MAAYELGGQTCYDNLGRVRQNPLRNDIPLRVQLHCNFGPAAGTVKQDVLCTGDIVHKLGVIWDVRPALGRISRHTNLTQF